MSRRRAALWGFVAVISVFLAALIIIASLFTAVLASNYKNLGVLFQVASRVKTHYIEPVSTDRLINGAIRGMVDSLDDPYSVYMDPAYFKQLTEQVTGVFGGVGIVVEMQKDHLLTVVAPIKGTPAYKAGVKRGDIIIEIDGKKIEKMDMETAINKIKGPTGTIVKLTVYRKGKPEPLKFNLKREIITVPTVEGEMVKDTKIAHIRITQFSERTPDELDKTLTDLKKNNYKGVILDLRDNPGGELGAAVAVADTFVPPNKPIVYTQYRVGKSTVEISDAQRINLPLVVLVNGGSASASEIVSGAIKDTKAGTLVGEKTFGKGVIQEILPLREGAGLKLTTGRYLTPAKHFIHKKGIKPDVVVKQPVDSKKDLQLEKAIEILKKKM